MLQVGKLREGEKSKANNVLFKCMRKKSLCGHPRPVILQSVTWELLFFTETIWDFSQATVKKMTIQDFFSAFCLSTSAVSLCIAYLCGVFAWGMRPCVKEQTGGEEKLPSEFNLRWGTKYSLLLIPRSDIGRYKKKKIVYLFSYLYLPSFLPNIQHWKYFWISSTPLQLLLPWFSTFCKLQFSGWVQTNLFHLVL